MLTWYDTVGEVKAAVESRMIIFLSHQWKGRTEPDPNKDDWKAAVLGAIDALGPANVLVSIIESGR